MRWMRVSPGREHLVKDMVGWMGEANLCAYAAETVEIRFFRHNDD